MKRSFYLIIGILAVLLSGCGKQSQKKVMTAADSLSLAVLTVRNCSKLYTSEIKIHKIVTFDDVSRLRGSLFSREFNIKLPLGSRKVAIPLDATLKAYIDFSDFSEENVKVDSIGGRRKLTVILPDPQLVVTASKVNNAGIREYVSWLRPDFTDAELTNFTRQGMEAIDKSIPKMDIISDCRLHATRVLQPIFTQMGYKEENITIVFRKEFTPQDVPLLKKVVD